MQRLRRYLVIKEVIEYLIIKYEDVRASILILRGMEGKLKATHGHNSSLRVAEGESSVRFIVRVNSMDIPK